MTSATRMYWVGNGAGARVRVGVAVGVGVRVGGGRGWGGDTWLVYGIGRVNRLIGLGSVELRTD